MKVKSLFYIPRSMHTIRWFLLVISLFLFAFTHSDYFRFEFQFPELVSRFETQLPSADYTTKLGIEIEGYYTEKRNTDGRISLKPYNDLVELSTQRLKELGYPFVFDKPLGGKEKTGSIGVYYSVNAQTLPRRLMFAPDQSIFHTLETKPVEIVSPILETKSDVDTFFALVEAINKNMKFTAEPINSGTHFHFDFKNPQPEEILILTIVMEKILPEIKDLFSIQDSRLNEYATPYSVDDFKTLVAFTENVRDVSQTEHLPIYRHRSTNWQALGKHGTFEFRAFNSTNDIKLLAIQVDLVQKIVKAVRLRDPKLLRLLKSPSLSLLNLRHITTALGCLLDDPQAEHYVREKTKQQVEYSKKAKIQPQAGFLVFSTLTLDSILNSRLGNPTTTIRPRLSAFTPNSPYTHSNVTFRQPPSSTSSCQEFYQ